MVNARRRARIALGLAIASLLGLAAVLGPIAFFYAIDARKVALAEGTPTDERMTTWAQIVAAISTIAAFVFVIVWATS